MKLYEKYPDSIVYNGKTVRLNLGYKNVLRMIDTLSRDNLTIEARNYLALKCICRRPKIGMLPEVKKMLFPQQGGSGERITDYEQDADLIISAFRQVYNIDLVKENINWFLFGALLSSLPASTRYSEVLSIRAKPIPNPTKYNAEERNALISAKAAYALKLPEAEREKKLSDQIGNIANYLLSMAGDGE